MKMKVFAILLVVFVIGCTSDLPPDPKSVGSFDSSLKTGFAYYGQTDNYAPPFDIFDDNENIFFINPEEITIGDKDSFSMEVSVNHPDAFVYKRGYYYSTKDLKWVSFEFPDETYQSSNWIRDSASVDLELPVDSFIGGDNFIVTYSCKKYSGEWKCGCSSSTKCRQWMLHVFNIANPNPSPSPSSSPTQSPSSSPSSSPTQSPSPSPSSSPTQSPSSSPSSSPTQSPSPSPSSSPTQSPSQSIIPSPTNIKNMAKYSDKEVFIVSDKDWHEVLSIVPLAIWTDDEIIKYPLLIYHVEKPYDDGSTIYTPVDADSTMHFLRDYAPDHIKLFGSTPRELTEGIVAEPGFGAGIPEQEIESNIDYDYLSYWDTLTEIVYVEDDYTTALVASTYASLLNAPLIIEGYNEPNDLDQNVKVTCIGNVNRDCDEVYSIKGIQKKYAELTNSDKLVLVNPDDLDIKLFEVMSTGLSIRQVNELYSKASLAAPIIASAKHQIIIQTNSRGPQEISQFIKQNVEELMPSIINNEDGYYAINTNDPMSTLIKKNINTGEENIIAKTLTPSSDFGSFDEGIIWKSYRDTWVYSNNSQLKRYPIRPAKYKWVGDKIYAIMYSSEGLSKSKAYSFDILTGEKETIMDVDTLPQEMAISERFLVWTENSEGKCYSSGNNCTNNVECNTKYCQVDKTACEQDTDCGPDKCIFDFCRISQKELKILDMASGQIETIARSSDFKKISMDGNNIIFVSKQNLVLYNIETKEKVTITNRAAISLSDRIPDAQIKRDYVLYTVSDHGTLQLKLYHIPSKKTIEISGGEKYYDYNRLFEDKIVWPDTGSDKVCSIDNEQCTADNDCVKLCQGTDKTCSTSSDCSTGFCSSQKCTPTYLNIKDLYSQEKKRIYTGKEFDEYIIVGDNLYLSKSEQYGFYLSGYLTVIGADNAIPFREDVTQIGRNSYLWLDQTFGDIYLDDEISDMAVGRIQGITIADVSSLIARSIFYENMERKNKVSFLASSFNYAVNLAGSWSAQFEKSGYSSECSIRPTETITSVPGCSSTGSWIDYWKDKDLVHYMDHGGTKWAGIHWYEIPPLSNTLVLNDACTTCSTMDKQSFCNNVIRNGAIAHLGNLAIAKTGNTLFKDTLNRVYGENLPLGVAFSSSYIYSNDRHMAMLFGDPTLVINPEHTLKEDLQWVK